MKAKGINFKFLMLHIDSMMMSDVVLHGEEFECWRYMKLHMKYLKEECNLTYDRAAKLISVETLDKLISEYYLVEKIGEKLTKEELGGYDIHSKNGVIDNVTFTEKEAMDKTKLFLSYMPNSIYQIPSLGKLYVVF